MTIKAPSAGGRLLLLLGCAFVAGCASTAPGPAPILDRSAPRAPATTASTPPAAPAEPGTHVVQRGDTLYGIARQYNQDPKNIIIWNRIENPNAIAPGQRVRVAPPGTTAAVAPAAGTAGVEVKPIVPPGGVESRPLAAGGEVASEPFAPAAPAATPVGEARPETRPPAAGGAAIKREPRGGKQPYSEQAWEKARAGEEAATGAPAVAAAPAVTEGKPAGKPENKAETKAESKPEGANGAAGEAKLPPAEPRPADANGMDWAWPTSGKVVGNFNDSTSKGIDIGGKLGDPVLAAASGKVLYAGQDLRGYGKLVVVKHSNQYLSVYAHNSEILVKEGQAVGKGQKIAELGKSDASEPKLHFEIRRQGKPVDPLQYLPAR